MEFSKIYGFFVNINHRSIKLILKIGKSMASVAIITHSVLSILMFSFTISIKFLLYNRNMSYTPATNPTSSSSHGIFLRHMLVYAALIFIAEFAFILAFVAISHISSVATILISAASYNGKNISFHDFISMIAKKWKGPWITGFRGSRTQPARYSVLVVYFAVVLLVMYPNALTFWVSIVLGIIAAIFVMYSSVVWILAMVASVVEEGCFGKEALEKGEELAKGHRVHGFLLNVFFDLVGLVPFVVYWLVYGDKLLLGFPYLGLVMVNIFCLVKMLVTVEYTVLYFDCKKYHQHIIQDFQYTKLPSQNAAAAHV